MLQRRFNLAPRVGCLCLLATLSLSAQRPQRLTSLAAIHAISNETAAHTLPVAFEGSVTYHETGNTDLFVQDGDAAIYVEAPKDLKVATGDRVLVEGVTRASFRPEILAQRITFLRHGTPPPPVQAEFPQLIRGELDCRRSTIRAVVRSADLFSDGVRQSVLLDLVMPGGIVRAQIADGGASANLLSLLDSTVDLTGAVAGLFDSKDQMTGVLLEVPSFADLRIVTPAPRSARQIPLRKFDEILHSVHIEDQTERVRVQGTVTYYQPGAAMVLQDGSNALWVDTRSEEPHPVGDHAFVSGFPDVRNGAIVLTRGQIDSTRSDVPLKVDTFEPAQLASGLHAFELVSVEGQLIMRVRQSAQDQYVVASHGQVFSAIYRHPERGLNLPVSPMRDIRLGSRVRITGICVLDKGDQFRGPVAFHMLMRSSDDVAILAGPSLVSVKNLAILLGFLLIAMFLVIARALLVERKMRRQSAATASTVERWRTRVIDGINNAVPLRETLTQITELLSFKLHADFCWVEIELEGTFGNFPGTSERPGLDVIEQTIPSRTGKALARLCLAFRAPRVHPRIGPDAFENAIRLAALAIETGAEYSDLVRRSEIDALTGAQNRFAFERALERSFEIGRQSGGSFALIYIDLDGFKEVNDAYGHHIGDRYLQETVSRLKHHLRSNDALGRLGGDEFAVLITSLNSAEEAGEILIRLRSCFHQPFSFDGLEISGDASMGCAAYPQDGNTPAALLQASDARMYRDKRHKAQRPAGMRLVKSAADLHG